MILNNGVKWSNYKGSIEPPILLINNFFANEWYCFYKQNRFFVLISLAVLFLGVATLIVVTGLCFGLWNKYPFL